MGPAFRLNAAAGCRRGVALLAPLLLLPAMLPRRCCWPCPCDWDTTEVVRRRLLAKRSAPWLEEAERAGCILCGLKSRDRTAADVRGLLPC